MRRPLNFTTVYTRVVWCGPVLLLPPYCLECERCYHFHIVGGIGVLNCTCQQCRYIHLVRLGVRHTSRPQHQEYDALDEQAMVHIDPEFVTQTKRVDNVQYDSFLEV